MSTKAEAKESTIVADAPETVPTIEELKEQLAAANEWRAQLINEAWGEAESHNWCSDFDAVCVRLHLPKRTWMEHANYRIHFLLAPPEGRGDTYTWANSEDGRTAAIERLEELLAQAKEGDFSGFGVFQCYETKNVIRKLTADDVAESPMKLVRGRPQITRVSK